MEGTTRSGLLLYFRSGGDVHILLGLSYAGLTTIGGRSLHEHEVDRLIREVKEETRGLLDYSRGRELLLGSQHFYFDRCYYCVVESNPTFLNGLVERYSKTQSDRDVSNELVELVVVSCKTLVRDMVTTRKIKCTTCFTSMFKQAGFDFLFGNKHNHLAENICHQATITEPIHSVPAVVCIQPFPNIFPRVYGTIQKMRNGKPDTIVLYVGDQFYFEEGGELVFSSGIHRIQR